MSEPPTPPTPPTPSDGAYWEAAYAEHRDAWELGAAAPPLVRALTGDAPWFAPTPTTRAIVIGCGRGHEARLVASLGAHVVGLDFAAAAIADAARATPPELAPRITWRQADLFAVPPDEGRRVRARRRAHVAVRDRARAPRRVVRGDHRATRARRRAARAVLSARARRRSAVWRQAGRAARPRARRRADDRARRDAGRQHRAPHR